MSSQREADMEANIGDDSKQQDKDVHAETAGPSELLWDCVRYKANGKWEAL